MAEKKYYWLKLKRDFFKRHDIRIIESMPNGKDYILFYLKLLLESVDHEGALRFSETIPYNEDMLSVVTNTNVDVVRSAMKLFVELGMMEILDDCTIYMNEVQALIGSETRWAEKKRAYRLKEDNVLALSTSRPPDVRQEIEIEKELELEKELEVKKRAKRFTPPSLSDVQAYCLERNKGVDPERWFNHYTANGWMVGKNKMKDWKAAVRTWESRVERKETGFQTSNPFSEMLEEELSRYEPY